MSAPVHGEAAADAGRALAASVLAWWADYTDCRACRYGWETSESGRTHDNPDGPETIACTAREPEPAFVGLARAAVAEGTAG